MKALEFQSKIEGDQFKIPIGIRSKLKTNQNKDVRVIVLIDDSEIHDDLAFGQIAEEQFLNGYAEADSIYDDF